MLNSSRLNGICLLALIFACGHAIRAEAAIHIYDVVSTSGYSGSWLHSATSAPITGTPENGPRWNGDAVSDRITGILSGDLDNNVLSNVSGNVTGKFGAMSSYFGYSPTDSRMFELRLGESIAGGEGALRFETDGAGSGQFTGGFLDFALDIVGGPANLVTGTFFFKPQAETPSALLTPNRGDSDAFTLWGLNWMHDGGPVPSGTSIDDWLSFLSDGLGYSGTEEVDRSSSTLGIALYAVDRDPTVDDGMHNPEPTALVVWGLLAMLGATTARRDRS